MKKPLKIAGIILLSIIVLVVLIFAGIFINNKIQLSSEAKKIVPYGETIPIDGKK